MRIAEDLGPSDSPPSHLPQCVGCVHSWVAALSGGEGPTASSLEVARHVPNTAVARQKYSSDTERIACAHMLDPVNTPS